MSDFRFNERPGSGRTTKDTAELLYVATGTDNEQFVRSSALGLTPHAYANAEGFLWRQDISVVPRGHKIFHVDATYGKQKKENGSYTWNFETLGGTVHIKNSLETVGKYCAAGVTPADFKGAIGVQAADQPPDGTDIVIPAMKLNVLFKHPLGVITLPRVKQLARHTANVSSDTWLDHFAPGEVLFLGAKGSQGTDSETEVAYEFACSENATGLNIGDIADIEKQGHDLIWIKFKPAENDGKSTQIPQQVNVERVYRRTNFAALFGFGG